MVSGTPTQVYIATIINESAKTFPQSFPRLFWGIAEAGLIIYLSFIPSQARAATPITPSGLNTQVNLAPVQPPGKVQYNITGGTRPGGGTNLFHSFGNFNVPNNNVANFLNDSGLATSNILGRVTGGNISNIFGAIQTTGFGNTNLFLMNPAGFLFGPNATVNVGGMVSFTTADYLRLTDGKLFNAVPNQAADALLSTAPVAAYGFLGSNPGAITVQGSQLSVKPGQSISLIGGNITIESGSLDNGTVHPALLAASGGQINLASVASPGEILAGTMDQAPNVNGQSFGALGSIQVLEQSHIDVSGGGGGTVLIRGGQFLIDNSTISANITGPGPFIDGKESIGGGIDVVVNQNVIIQNAGVLETNVLGNATPGVQYGGIHVKADQIEIIGTQDFDNAPFTGIRSNVSKGNTGGDSGDIKLEANSVQVTDFGTATTFIESITEGAGSAGDLIVRTTGNISIDGGQIDTETQGATGNAGDVEVTSTNGNISISNFGVVTSQAASSTQTSAFGSGNTGKITASAPEGNIVLDSGYLFTGTRGSGLAGQTQITAKNLELSNFSAISDDNFGLTKPGGINIALSGHLTVDSNSVIATASVSPTGAPAADLNISAKDIVVTQGSFITSGTFASGPGGRLTIVTDTLHLTDGGHIISGSTKAPARGGLPQETPTGPGGDVSIQATGGPTGSVLIDGAGSGIFTNTEGTGAGGNTTLTAKSLTIQNAGTISASTSGISQSATGGSVTISAGQFTFNSGGTITASSTGPARAGAVTIQGLPGSPSAVMVDGAGSGIFTDTKGTGAGGNILVDANSVIVQNGGSLSAATSGTAPSAIGGTITVNANQVQVNSGGLITAATTGAGAGGSVNINAGNTFSSDAGIVSSTATQANGGNINMSVGQSVTLTDGASVSASSTGQGNAGSININAGQAFTASNSKVTTEANQSGGGIIKITTNPNGTVQLTDSTISASVLDGNGGGGSVNIDPQSVVLINSQILAQAVQGPGGNINITTNLLLPDSTSIISASSQFGQQGTVIIQSPISPASGKIVPLGQKPLIATSLLSQRCTALAGGTISSFTVAGRDSLPAEPGGWVSTPLALSISGSEEGTVREADRGVEDETPLLSLRKIAPPGFLTQAFAVDSSGCS